MKIFNVEYVVVDRSFARVVFAVPYKLSTSITRGVIWP
jgi:hypothetical protein